MTTSDPGQRNSAGASAPGGSPGFVVVGRITVPHGPYGAVRVLPMTDVPGRFAPGARLFVNGAALVVRNVGTAKPPLLTLTLEGVSSRTAADALRGVLLEVPEGEVPPPPEGAYYHYQLLGMAVSTTEGERLGVLVDVLETGANDVYLVREGDAEVLIPAIGSVVVEVDPASKRMVVDLPEGLR